LYEYSHLLEPPEKPDIHIPYNILTRLAQVAPPGNEHEFIKTKLDEYSYLHDTIKGLDDRIQYALNWVKDFEEQSRYSINLTIKEKNAIKAIIYELEIAKDENEYQSAIFKVSKALDMKARELFSIVYQILIGRPQGPRFGPYVTLVGKKTVINSLKEAI
jgi:lysyl-tRNA synthetase class 1